jgi:hypothetical protein
MPGWEQLPLTSEPRLPDAASAGTEADALAIAQTYRHSVRIDSQTTPLTLVEALPSGAFRATGSLEPQRTNVDGEWVDLDPTLVARDEWIEPATAAAPVRFSTGGRGPLAQVRSATGQWMTMSWPAGDLPAPSVQGATATYANVFTDVDLVLTATPGGMTQVLVVKTKAAAESPELSKVTFEIEGAALAPERGVAKATRSLEASPESGGEAIASGTPLWWDSSAQGASASGPGDGGEAAVVSAVSTSSEMTLDIGTIVDNEPVAYPLYVDPPWNPLSDAWWYTDRAFPNQSYLRPGSMSVGYGIENGVHYLSRAYMQFDITPMRGKDVISSMLSVWQTWANSCDQTLVQLWRFSPHGTPGFSWNGRPNGGAQLLDQQGAAKGSQCVPAGNIGWNATVGLRQQLSEGSTALQLELMSANEGHSLTRKHFNGPVLLQTVYNSPPNLPTDYSMSSPVRANGTATSPAYVNNQAQDLNFRAKATDPDGGNVAIDVVIAKASEPLKDVWRKQTGLETPGSWLTVKVPKETLRDGDYVWRLRSLDGSLGSGWTPWMHFVSDSVAPSAPTILVTGGAGWSPDGLYPDNSVAVDAGNHVGDPVNVTLQAPGAGWFQVWVASGGAVSPVPPADVVDFTAAPACDSSIGARRIVCADANSLAKITIAATNRLSSLWVAAYDKAGNVSATSGIGLRAESMPTDDGFAWIADDLGISEVPNSKSAVMPLVIGKNEGWEYENPALADGAAVKFSGALPTPAERTMTPERVIDTRASFTVSARVKANTANGIMTAVSQDGTVNSGFYLQAADGHWRFCVRSQSPSVTNCVSSAIPVQVGQWVTVVAVWDSVNKQIRIGVRTGSSFATVATYNSPPVADSGANGRLVLGSGLADALAMQPWNGSIGAVSVYQGVADDLQQLGTPVPLNAGQ